MHSAGSHTWCPNRRLMPGSVQSAVDWAQVEADFEPDGALRDVYVLDADLPAWQRVIDVLVQRYACTFERDGVEERMPDDITGIFHERRDTAVLLRVHRGTTPKGDANCHFFDETEIEFDLDPSEVRNQADLNAVMEFLRLVGDAAARPAVLAYENSRAAAIVTYDTRSQSLSMGRAHPNAG